MAKELKIDLKPLKIGRIKVKIVGTTPFLPEPMDMAVLERYDQKKSNKTYKKDDVSESEKVKEKYYYTEDGKKGIPARAFYKSMIKASTYFFDKNDGGMRNIKEGLIVKGNILPLKYKKEKVVTHWGRTSGRTGSPRKIMRNQFEDWSCDLEIEFNQAWLSAEQIINILNWAGFHIGVGGFRRENTGNYGSFTVKL
jgi:hypothetical protein